MQETVDSLTERLRFAIKRAGGPERLAQMVGVTHQTVYLWRAGSKPYPRRIPEIARACGVSSEWLETGRGEMLETNRSARIEESMECPLHLPAATPTERMIELAAEKMTAADLANYIARVLRDAATAPAERYNIASRLTAQLAHRISTERPPIKYN